MIITLGMDRRLYPCTKMAKIRVEKEDFSSVSGSDQVNGNSEKVV